MTLVAGASLVTLQARKALLRQSVTVGSGTAVERRAPWPG